MAEQAIPKGDLSSASRTNTRWFKQQWSTLPENWPTVDERAVLAPDWGHVELWVREIAAGRTVAHLEQPMGSG